MTIRNGIRERPSNNIIDKNDLQDVHGQFDRARSLGLPRQSGRVHVLKPLEHGLAPTRWRLVYPFAFEVEALALQLYLMRDEELHP